MGRNALDLQYRSQKGMPSVVAADFEKTLAKYGDEVKRYDTEKEEIKDKPGSPGGRSHVSSARRGFNPAESRYH